MGLQYHLAFIPKRRKKRIFGPLRRHLDERFRALAGHKESKLVEGHLMGDQVPISVLRHGKAGGGTAGNPAPQFAPSADRRVTTGRALDAHQKYLTGEGVSE